MGGKQQPGCCTLVKQIMQSIYTNVLVVLSTFGITVLFELLLLPVRVALHLVDSWNYLGSL